MELLIRFDRRDDRSLQVQLYEEMRRLILSGTLRSGQRLPSSREVSEQFGIARNTVMLAFDRLRLEGYVAAREKAGMFVSDSVPDSAVLVGDGPSDDRLAADPIQLGRLPAFTARAPELWRDPKLRPALDLAVGRPHPASFPTTFWRRCAARHLARCGGPQTQYGDPRGLLKLRYAIAAHLSATRGIEASPDQILITSGIQGALNLLARLLIGRRPPQQVAIENPCYQGAAYLFSSYGARLFGVDVDDQGVVVPQLEAFSGALLYVTPSHQFPTGCTMTLDRRQQLLEWAYRTGTYVIEDDYDSDFRYDGPPLTALAGLDRGGRVIYLGTFSKSIGPGMRLGYAVLPSRLVEPARNAKALLDNGAQWLEQAVVADFLAQGEFLRHLRRIRQMYLAARNALVEAIGVHFPGSRLTGTESGMHILWRLPDGLPDVREMQRLAATVDVGLYGLPVAAAFEVRPREDFAERALVVGYTGLSPEENRVAVERVARALRSSPA